MGKILSLLSFSLVLHDCQTTAAEQASSKSLWQMQITYHTQQAVPANLDKSVL